MDPNLRDEDAENMLESFIRGPGGDPDVTKWMNDSGEGDPELARRDGSGEGDDDGEADGSGRTLEITNSGEVHIC